MEDNGPIAKYVGPRVWINEDRTELDTPYLIVSGFIEVYDEDESVLAILKPGCGIGPGFTDFCWPRRLKYARLSAAEIRPFSDEEKSGSAILDAKTRTAQQLMQWLRFHSKGPRDASKILDFLMSLSESGTVLIKGRLIAKIVNCCYPAFMRRVARLKKSGRLRSTERGVFSADPSTRQDYVKKR